MDMLPGGGLPLAFGTLRYMDPRAAGMASAAKELLPRRIWEYLVRHPEEIVVRATEPGQYGFRHASGAYSPAHGVMVRPDAGPEVMGHELVHAAQDLRGIGYKNPPGLRFPEIERDYMWKGYPWEGEALPTLVSDPAEAAPFKTRRLMDLLEKWFPEGRK
jgi:hypothetical protein